MTPQEALDAIGRLCDEREHGPGPGWVAVDEVRAVLAAATHSAPSNRSAKPTGASGKHATAPQPETAST